MNSSILTQSGCNLARGNEKGQHEPLAGFGSGFEHQHARARVSAATGLHLLLPIALAAAVLSCAKRPAVPPTAELEAKAARAYRHLVESLGVDVSPLSGRVIVLDPGHGGGYRGAIGPRGTAEADVNLAVALFLWGLLRDAGADVHLTRSADRDFIGGELVQPVIGTPGIGAPADSLPSDLAARTALANSLHPDLFLSIHHNADATGDTTRNQTQTFYRLGDPGPSLDAAQAIHRHLMRNLETASGKVLPGNYHVLRNSNAVAAVLGEPSFVTNPRFEEKLLRIDRVELEASAYFLGLRDYFARGVAQAAVIAPSDTVLDQATVDLRVRFSGAPIDPATIAVRVNGEPVPALPVPVSAAPSARLPLEFVAAPPRPLANGQHDVTVQARTLGGNAAAPAHARFNIQRPPAEIHAEAWPAWSGADSDVSGPLGLAVSVRDRLGLPVADSTLVELTSPTAASALTRGGEAWFRLATHPGPAAEWTVRAGSAATASVPVATPGAPAAWAGSIVDRAIGRGIGGAEIRAAADRKLLGRTNPAGDFAVPAPRGAVAIAASGYLPLQLESPRERIELSPVLGGVLHGRRVVIDAAGGGADPLFVSPTGVRAADTALDVARRLAAEIARAGALPTLTRGEDATLPDLARVEAAESAGADRFLGIGADREARVRHYPGSARGQRLAQAVAREIGLEIGIELAVQAEVTPTLLATSMPAVEVLLPAPTEAASEDAHLDPDFRRRVARALLLALASEAGLDLGGQATALVTTQAPHILLDEAAVVPVTRGSIIVRGLEPSPARHRVAPLDAAGIPGPPIEFAAEVRPGGADTLRVVVPAGH